MGILAVVRHVTKYHNYAVTYNGTRMTAHGFSSKAKAQEFIEYAEKNGFTLCAGKRSGVVVNSCIVVKTEKVKTLTSHEKAIIAWLVGGAWVKWSDYKKLIRDSGMMWEIL